MLLREDLRQTSSRKLDITYRCITGIQDMDNEERAVIFLERINVPRMNYESVAVGLNCVLLLLCMLTSSPYLELGPNTRNLFRFIIYLEDLQDMTGGKVYVLN
jgi:hypothetical protein